MFYIYIILGILLIHCTIYYLNIDIFHLFTKNNNDNTTGDLNISTKNNTNNDINNDMNNDITNDITNTIETSINELKNLNQYIDNELGQTTFC
jgi:hypothetical protein